MKNTAETQTLEQVHEAMTDQEKVDLYKELLEEADSYEIEELAEWIDGFENISIEEQAKKVFQFRIHHILLGTAFTI